MLASTLVMLQFDIAIKMEVQPDPKYEDSERDSIGSEEIRRL